MTRGAAAGTARSRAAGALYGLAIGDALGMPTESLSRPQIVARYGELITDFAPGAPDQPVAPGLPAGSVTDDTEQAVLLAELAIEGRGTVDPHLFAARLLSWEQSKRASGAPDLLGPSTKRAFAAIVSGVPVEEAGRFGVTNGAAMRIAPVGVATPAAELDLLVDRVVQASRVTHNTSVALAGAAAVAAAVSAGIDGATLTEAIGFAVGAARAAGQRGYWAAGADVGTRVTWATGLVAGLTITEAVDVIDRLVGTSLATQESVPAAFAVAATAVGDPWLACRIAASLGGDCDTIAAMAGAICGARHGAEAFPESARSLVTRVNDLRLDYLAAGLLCVRAADTAVD